MPALRPAFVRLGAAVAAAVLLATGCGGPQNTAADGKLPGSDHVHALRVVDDGSLLLGLHGALWRSDDGGQTWQQAGLEGQDAMSIAAVGDEAPMFVAGHDVLARSDDGGQTFQPLSPADLPSLDIHAFAQAASDPALVYAFVVGHGIYASADAGATWEPRARVGEDIGEDVFTMVVDPRDPEVVLAGGGATGLLRSTDGARSFIQVSPHGFRSLAVRPDESDRLVAVTTRGIDASDDRGQTWRNVIAPGAEGLPVEWVAIAAGPDEVTWLVTEEPRTLQRSDDGGQTWTEVARAG